MSMSSSTSNSSVPPVALAGAAGTCSTDRLEQLASLEGLLEPGHRPVLLLRIGAVLAALEHAGDEDDRQLWELLPQLIREVVPHHVRQQHVEHGQRRRVAPGDIERLLRLRRRDHVVPRILEEVRQERQQLEIVIDDEEARSRHS